MIYILLPLPMWVRAYTDTIFSSVPLCFSLNTISHTQSHAWMRLA